MDIFKEHQHLIKPNSEVETVDVVENADINSFGELTGHPDLPDELQQELMQADIVLLPRWGFRDVEGPIFPHGTQDFYHYLLQNKSKDLNINVAVTDDEFKELALYSHQIVDLATLLVHPSTVTAVGSLVAGYCAWRRQNRVKLGIKVSQAKGRSITINYEGDPKKLESTLTPILARLKTDENDLPKEAILMQAVTPLAELPAPSEVTELDEVVLLETPKQQKRKSKKPETKSKEKQKN